MKDLLLERSLTEPMKSFREYSRIRFHALGTSNEILFQARSRGAAESFRLQALDWLAGFESRWSAFLDDSLLNRINQCAGGDAVDVDEEGDELFSLCDWFHWSTEGRFDATSGPLMDLWDYHKPREVTPTPEEISLARSLVGWTKTERTKGSFRLPVTGMRLNLGGIGKEYAVDQLINLAERMGISNILVNLGNDLRVSGSPPEGEAWRLGLENPESPNHCWGGVAVKDLALCCSGDYQRNVTIEGKTYSHIIDPTTGYPATSGCRAAWVLAPSCTQAGILSTCLCMMDINQGLRLLEGTPGVEGCLWTERGIVQSGGFNRYAYHEEKNHN